MGTARGCGTAEESSSCAPRAGRRPCARASTVAALRWAPGSRMRPAASVGAATIRELQRGRSRTGIIGQPLQLPGSPWPVRSPTAAHRSPGGLERSRGCRKTRGSSTQRTGRVESHRHTLPHHAIARKTRPAALHPTFRAPLTSGTPKIPSLNAQRRSLHGPAPAQPRDRGGRMNEVRGALAVQRPPTRAEGGPLGVAPFPASALHAETSEPHGFPRMAGARGAGRDAGGRRGRDLHARCAAAAATPPARPQARPNAGSARAARRIHPPRPAVYQQHHLRCQPPCPLPRQL